MNFHLMQGGQDAGEFSISELRRRREAGELTGAELVWHQGMKQWQPLDTVLPRRLPPPLVKTVTVRAASGGVASPSVKRRNLILAFVAIGIVLFFLAGATFFAIHFMKGYRRAVAMRKVVPKTAVNDDYRLDGGRATALRPIVWTTNTLTEAQLLPRRREFRLRQWVEGYRERGNHKEWCDEDAKVLIQAWVDTHYGLPHMNNVPPLIPLAEKVAVQSVCNEPMALTVAAHAGIERAEEIRRLERAVKAFENSKHRGYPKFFAAVSLANLVEKDVVRRDKLDAQALRWLAEAFADGSFLPGDQDEIADALLRTWGWRFFRRHQRETVKIVQSGGKPFQWLACLLEGQREIFLAWNTRGNRQANTVSQTSRKGFKEHSARARALLAEAWKLNPKNSLPASRMVYVAMGDSGLEEMRRWFDRATTAQIDDFNAWDNLQFGIRPRWHGNLNEMLDLGIAAVDTGRFDTQVPRRLLDVIGDIEQEMNVQPPEHIYGRPDIWPHLQQMYEGYITDPATTGGNPDGWHSEYVTVAYFAGKWGEARKQLEALHWRMDPYYLRNRHKDLSLLPLEVAARTGPAAQKIDAAESLFNEGDTGKALKLFSSLRSATAADERAREFVENRIATLEFEQKLAGGGWVDFLPKDPDDPLWLIERGKVQVLPDGAVEVKSGNDGHYLYCRARLGVDFEIRGEFEVVDSTTSSFQAGVVFGVPDLSGNQWSAFRMKRNATDGQIASLSRGWNGEKISHPVRLDTQRNVFDFRHQSGYAKAIVNDAEGLQLARLNNRVEVPDSEYRVGLGALNDENETVIRYRKVQVRKLPSTTPKPANPTPRNRRRG